MIGSRTTYRVDASLTFPTREARDAARRHFIAHYRDGEDVMAGEFIDAENGFAWRIDEDADVGAADQLHGLFAHLLDGSGVRGDVLLDRVEDTDGDSPDLERLVKGFFIHRLGEAPAVTVYGSD